MCEQCGCAATPEIDAHRPTNMAPSRQHPSSSKSVEILTGILGENDRRAAHNREHLRAPRDSRRQSDVLARIGQNQPAGSRPSMPSAAAFASPSSKATSKPKTTRGASAPRACPRCRSRPDRPATSTPHMVHDALHALDLAAVDILFIENVGNLVCPASFDLGQHAQRRAARGHRRRRQAGKISDDVPRSPISSCCRRSICSTCSTIFHRTRPRGMFAHSPNPAEILRSRRAARDARAVDRLARAATRGMPRGASVAIAARHEHVHHRAADDAMTDADRREGLARAHPRAAAGRPHPRDECLRRA